MKRVFFDSSVLVAATASLEGGSALILGWCRRGKLTGYVSVDVLGEAKKNVALKLGAAYLLRFEEIIEKSRLVLVSEPAVELISGLRAGDLSQRRPDSGGGGSKSGGYYFNF